MGGTIQGGTIATSGGSQARRHRPAGGTLAGVTLAGTLDLTTAGDRLTSRSPAA